MNLHVYRLIWSAARGASIVAPETARGRGAKPAVHGGAGQRQRRRRLHRAQRRAGGQYQ
ncbi:MAG: ESPR-type extended signal peptide-containing protein [Noviherbaspirillum sp.]